MNFTRANLILRAWVRHSQWLLDQFIYEWIHPKSVKKFIECNLSLINHGYMVTDDAAGSKNGRLQSDDPIHTRSNVLWRSELFKWERIEKKIFTHIQFWNQIICFIVFPFILLIGVVRSAMTNIELKTKCVSKHEINFVEREKNKIFYKFDTSSWWSM